MPFEITMPQLSDTMTQGTVTRWLKKEGEAVKTGDVIAEIETDKANMEMEAFETGTLAVALAGEGAKVDVGQLIAVLATGKEDPGAVKTQYASRKNATGASKPAAAQAPAQAASGSLKAGGATAIVAAPARAAPSAAPQAPANDSRINASPLARRLARERSVDLAQIKGTGPGGRIVQEDVLALGSTSGAAVHQNGPTAIVAAPTAEPIIPRVGSGQKQIIPLTKMRLTIAQRLLQSKQTIPHYYETMDIDVEEVVRARTNLNAQLERDKIHLSIGDFLAKAVALALTIHPALNATFDGTQVTRYGDVHLGMAVALSDGLIVPVLRNIHQMGLREIRKRSADLVDRARAQKLKQDEMTGATFTVSNLGPFGIREFSAIINPPEVCILAVGAAEKRAVVDGDRIVARTMMSVCLSSDHRVVDGAVAAEFLRTLRDLMREPALMLM